MLDHQFMVKQVVKIYTVPGGVLEEFSRLTGGNGRTCINSVICLWTTTDTDLPDNGECCIYLIYEFF